MGETESLDTHEPLPGRLERHAFDRLIMLSDGVFAIAVTLAALEVRPGGPWTDLPSLWAALHLSVYSYMVSFAVTATYWTSHRDLFARLRHVDSVVTVLTLALLFAVALLPSTTRLIYEGGQAAAAQLYALSVGLVGLLQTLLWAYAVLKRTLTVGGVSRAYLAARTVLSASVTLVFFWLAVMLHGPMSAGQGATAIAVVAAIAVGRRLIMRAVERRR